MKKRKRKLLSLRGEKDDNNKDWVMDNTIEAKLVSKEEMERLDRPEESEDDSERTVEVPLLSQRRPIPRAARKKAKSGGLIVIDDDEGTFASPKRRSSKRQRAEDSTTNEPSSSTRKKIKSSKVKTSLPSCFNLRKL